MASASLRYWASQIPGYLASGAILLVAWASFGLSGWVALAVFAVLVAKDIVFFPYARRTLEAPHRSGREGLVGRRARVIEALDPVGRVRLDGEVWRARARRDDAPVGVGVTVRIEAVDGLELRVRLEGAET